MVAYLVAVELDVAEQLQHSLVAKNLINEHNLSDSNRYLMLCAPLLEPIRPSSLVVNQPVGWSVSRSASVDIYRYNARVPWTSVVIGQNCED